MNLEDARATRKGVESLNPLQKLQRNPKSRAQAVKAMCWQCMGEGNDSGWRWGIGNCTIPDCALYHFRPYQHLKDTPAQGVYSER